jgi:Flp pilus assembly protein TadG
MSDLMSPHSERGQVLPLMAIFMTALMLAAALAVDVTGVLSAERFYTTTAEAAALAGSQDLQQAKSRLITDNERSRARSHALDILVNRLEASARPSGAGCATTLDIVDCALPDTPFLVSVMTPAPFCVTCDPQRSIQVTIRNPSYGLTFARLAGEDDWNVTASAVANLQFSGKYAIQTLRPPHPLPNGTDQNRENISVDGTNTWVDVLRGDVGTNTSAYTNSGGRITLADGYRIDHIDDISPDPWNQVNGLPEGRLLRKLIPDPGYMIADFTGAPSYSRQEDGRWDAVVGNGPGACPPPGTEGLPTTYASVLQDPSLDVVCYLPGVYEDHLGFNVSQNTEVAYLLPGAYYFGGKGIDIGGRLMGGLISDEPGVVLVVPQDAELAANNSVAMVLNQGDESCAANDCRAAPAVDWAGQAVKSPEGLMLTIEVPRDEACFSGTTPLDVATCTTANSTVNIPGNGNLAVWGIVYAPSDNVQVNGDNTNQIGEVGQLIAWTVTYSGGAKLIQTYPEPDQVGVPRLDAACTGLEPCG